MINTIAKYALIAVLVLALATGIVWTLKRYGATQQELLQASQTIESQRAQLAVNAIQARRDREADAAALASFMESAEKNRIRANNLAKQLKEAKDADKELEYCLDHVRLPESVKLPD